MTKKENIPEQNQYVKLKKIHIDKFRRFHNVELVFGNKVTLICGRNCTSKSTALGLICQPLSFGETKREKQSAYTDAYHGLQLSDYKTLTGIPFKREAYQIFRFSRDFDTTRDLLYHVFFEGGRINQDSRNLKDGLMVRAEPRTTTKSSWLRFVAGRTHEKGEGNFPHPLIYLGLERLFPLASCENIEIRDDNTELTDDEKLKYEQCYNKILLLNEDSGIPESIRAERGALKVSLGHRTDEYNSESCSAGQDNIGQILTAVLSFKHLKEKLKEHYQGGIILIDEIDATLHPQAQKHLLEFLISAAEKYGLQIIATTHSLYMLQLALKSSLRPDISVLHLERHGKQVVCKNDATYEMIADFLKVESTVYKEKEKTVVMLEDDLAKKLFNFLLGGELVNYITIPDGHICGQLLGRLALIETSCFRTSLFVLDGDLSSTIPNSLKVKNLLALPSKDAIEKEMYFLLDALDSESIFWSNTKFPTYSKDVCFKNHYKYPSTRTPEDIENRDKEISKFKCWYSEQEKYWGHNGEYLLHFWMSQNIDKCKEFCKTFIEYLEKIRGEQIPSEIKNRIYQKFLLPEKDSNSSCYGDARSLEIHEKACPEKRARTKSRTTQQAIRVSDDICIEQPEFGF